MQVTRWTTFASVAALRSAAVNFILQSAEAAINTRGRFDIVLAGGSTPRQIYEDLRHARTDWSKWHIWYGDERCLPPEHADRNSKMANDAWLAAVSIPAAQVHPMPTENGSVEAAKAYSLALQGLAEFDLVLLGLGEDGHTASLFPGQSWESEPPAPAIPVKNAPKPPSDRVSLSASRLSQARQVLFIVTGAGKKDAVSQWRNGEPLPVHAITPTAGADIFVDAEAAAA
jgi:6-phosphogluconolactonase